MLLDEVTRHYTIMKTPVTPSPTACPQCGRPLPGGGLQGLCPACLLVQADATRSGERPGAGARFEPPSVADVAALFPRLEIIRLIGAGGMGAVYQARQPDLDRMVALKILPADGPGGTLFEERFNREARALARLSHPNIVSVHEFGRAGRHHFFLMEYVDGANLRQLEQAGRLSPREVLQVIPQICDALQYAHDEGVVHRDIKPENVLVDLNGRVKIADFGLARILGPEGDTGRLTVDGQVMGTPHYMAPEQVERPLSVDHRADIYSLGVVIYEMLTGDLPLGKFPPPSRKVEVDVRLDAVVLRALENDPERRYQRAGDVKTGVETVSRSPAPEAGTGDEEAGTGPAPVRHLCWAGIPVVVERDGEREVSFEGALGLVFATMSVAAVGHYLVRWLSGGEHAVPRMVWTAAVLTVFWAIRQTFRRQEPRAAVERTMNGTVVLHRRRLPRFLRDYLTLAALFVVVVGSHYLHRAVIRPLFGRPDAAAPQVARPEPASGALRAELEGGGRVELLAVSLPDAAPNQWWFPDGRPDAGTYEVHRLPCPGGMEDTGRAMVFRVVDLPSGSDGPFFEAGPGMSVAAGGVVFVNWRELPGARAACYSGVSAGQRIAPEVGVSVDPWRPLAAYHRDGRPAGSRRLPDDPHPRLQVHATSDSPEGARITAMLPRESRDWRFRIVAVDHSGVEHTERSMSGSLGPSGDDSILTFVFHGLRLEDVREFVAQARPVRWVRFPDVVLQPAGKLPEPRPLAFAPDQEVTVAELVDFDSGRVGRFPPGADGENAVVVAAGAVAWAVSEGFDAALGAAGLDLAGTVHLAVVEEAEWERLTPREVIDRVYERRFAPARLPVEGPYSGHRTYAYQTREGGFGLLRLVRVGPGLPDDTIRLRRITR